MVKNIQLMPVGKKVEISSTVMKDQIVESFIDLNVAVIWL